jgi:hypothetical protein
MAHDAVQWNGSEPSDSINSRETGDAGRSLLALWRRLNSQAVWQSVGRYASIRSTHALPILLGPCSEGDGISGTQEIPCTLWNPTVRYPVLKISLLDPIMSQMNPVRILRSCFLYNHFNIISLLRVDLSNDPFPSGFQTKIL